MTRATAVRASVRTRPVAGAPWVQLMLSCTGLFMIVLDATIVSVALPQIGRDLHFGTASLAWVVNAYTVAFAGVLLVGGRLIASHGPRPVFMVGLIGFGTASLVCGLSTVSGELIAARAVQGLAAALLMPATLTIVTTAYAEGPARARALGLWSAVGAGGAGAGTVLGGVLTNALGWRWVFLVNVPIAIAGAAAAIVALSRTAARHRVPLDLIGAALGTGGLVALVYGLLSADSHGWRSPAVYLPLTGGVALLAIFVWHQSQTDAALVPLPMFRSRPLSAANGVIFGLGLGFFASFVLLSVYLQDGLAYSPLKAGLAFIPAACALFTGAQLAGRLTHRFGVRLIATLGALEVSAGFGWLSQLSAHQGYWPGVAVPTVLFGLGIGVAFTPITIAATAVPAAMAGVAAGVLNTTRQVSGAVGLAVLTTVSEARLPAGARLGADPSGLAAGYDLAFGIAGAVALAAAVGAALLLPRRLG